MHRSLVRHERLHFHLTPTYSSSLGLVERFFCLATDRALRRGSHTLRSWRLVAGSVQSNGLPGN